MPKNDKVKEEVEKKVIRPQLEERKNSLPPRQLPTREISEKTNSQPEKKPDIFARPTTSANVSSQQKDDIFSRELKNNKIVQEGIPVIKNNKLESEVVAARSPKNNESKMFPDIKLEKKDNIFPELPEINNSNSFFDENEFNDLKDYVDSDNKNSWF